VWDALKKLLDKLRGVFSFFKVKPVPFPLGVKIILWYTAVMALFSFVIGIMVPVIYPEIFDINPFVILFNLVFLGVSAIIFKGIFQREYWAYKLMIIWYGVSIIYNFLYFFYSFEVFDIMMEVLLIGLVFSFVVNSVVIWYLISQHDYFKHRGIFVAHKRIRLAMLDANDHVFMVVFISFWFVTLLVFMFAGGKLLYDTFSLSDEVNADFEKIGYYDSTRCFEHDEMYKDVCLMQIGIAKGEESYCGDIVSPFYKFSCYLGI